MDRNQLWFKISIIRQNFRKVSSLGQISNCLTNKPFPYINRGKNQWRNKRFAPGGKALEGQLFDATS